MKPAKLCADYDLYHYDAELCEASPEPNPRLSL